ncbi:DUF6197 family protein [Stackebrandtia nassauensis]|uniref:Uncharacterized protein n=1 Tax=Stackebrandtia nassauensis (strain DSM 44728 / CIP 108903 / NRRL B-16338 / NBRC 102104 / LLR-40K-21) TaxID=446470 RepID=D3PWL7_STANL|nr:hypothetical protein [Stackebrandtia nassauensis]ADD43239.1 hypothetical protein Snas_3577 [Stackebrandtia nassauensis DSM 44728]
MTVHALHRAADLIEQRGWTRGGYCYPDAEGYCMDKALLAVCGLCTACENKHDLTDEYRDALAALRAALNVATCWDLWWWNDNSRRTKSDVVRLLRRAADHAPARRKSLTQ